MSHDAPQGGRAPELRRVTTEYIEVEDRLRLAGSTESGGVLVLWLTQRLANRLVAALANWLEKQSGQGLPADIAQGVALQAALSAHEPLPPVQPQGEAESVLVQTVDMTFQPQHCVLRFKAGAAGPERARVGFDVKQLRQWLGIVRQQYARAQWSTEAWPAWLAEAPRPPSPGQAVMLH